MRNRFIKSLLVLLWMSPFMKQAYPVNLYNIKGTEGERELRYTPCSKYKYQGNMNMIAQAHRAGKLILDCQIAVFDAAGECRACAFSEPENEGKVFLTIQGEGNGEELTFRVIYSENEDTIDVVADETITYINDALNGSLKSPYILNVSDGASGVAETLGEQISVKTVSGGVIVDVGPSSRRCRIFQLNGALFFDETIYGRHYIPLQPGVYIIGREKLRVR